MTVRRETIDVTATLRALFGDKAEIIKDLQEHERLCTACGGLGALKRDMPFAMRGPGEASSGWPYHQEYVGPCPNCYNGIEQLCEYCHAPLSRGHIGGVHWCNCAAADAERRQQAEEKEQQRIAKAKRVPLAEYQGDMLFEDVSEHYISVDDELDPDTRYYACDKVERWVGPAADELIEQLDNRAAEEWEDFEGLCITPEAKDALQNLLDAWFDQYVKLDPVYYADTGTIVVVPTEEP